MKIVTRSSAFLSTLISCTIFSGSLFAGGISLPGIKISPSGVEVGDIKITTDEVKIGDVFTSNDADSSPDGIVLSNGKFVRSDYSRENLAGARLLNSDFTRAKFDGADLRGAVFENSDFTRASFTGACLQGTKFISSNFTRAKFDSAVMTDTRSTYSEFSRASMEGVDNEGNCDDYDVVYDDQDRSDQAAADVRLEVTTATSILSALSSGVDARVNLTVNFAFDSDQVQREAHEQIYEIAAALRTSDLAANAIMIEGHTDSSGNNDYNMDLSFRRALRVKRILIQEYDIDAERLEIKGFGETLPIANNDNGAGRLLNRRVTLVNLGS